MDFQFAESRVAQYRQNDRHETQEIERDSDKSENGLKENRNVKKPCSRRCNGCGGMLILCTLASATPLLLNDYAGEINTFEVCINGHE